MLETTLFPLGLLKFQFHYLRPAGDHFLLLEMCIRDREKPMGRAKMTQADHLPTFMKTAKNRERIVKLLKKLQEK